MWVWVFVDYNMSGLLINSRDMFVGRVFWDFVCGSASSYILVREQVCYGE